MIPTILSIIVIILGILGDFPNVFYILLRFWTCGTAVYLGFQAIQLEKYFWVYAMGGITILFNPLVPIQMSKDDWAIIDILIILTFCIALFTVRSRKIAFPIRGVLICAAILVVFIALYLDDNRSEHLAALARMIGGLGFIAALAGFIYALVQDRKRRSKDSEEPWRNI